MTSHEIIQGCKAGQEQAYRYLVDTYADQLMGTCMRYLRDHQKAEDAVQETYIRVFKAIHRFDENGSLIAWMIKIAINCCLKEWRKSKRLSFNEEATVFENRIQLPDVYEKLTSDDLLILLDSLPVSYRIIFNLHVIEGYSHKEISNILGIQVSHSRTKLTRARDMLQEIYFVHLKKSVV
ncbi:MAG: RNA polymerase sigma factor [Saprospiraceae bacterium]